MVMRRSRHVTRQRVHPIIRSIFSPAPISAMMTANSANRSVTCGYSVGSGRNVTPGNRKIAAPIAMHTIGNDSGSRLSASGNQATRAIKSPAPVRTRI
jgi:hypothetical protein